MSGIKCAAPPVPSTRNPSREKRLAYAALGVVYLVWGSTYVGIRLVIAHMPPFIAAAIRFLCAGSALLLFTAA